MLVDSAVGRTVFLESTVGRTCACVLDRAVVVTVFPEGSRLPSWV